MTMIVIGIDGGGSKTRAIVADERGAEIVSVEGTGSAVRGGQVEEPAEVIAALVRDALEAADMPHVVPKVICAGIRRHASTSTNVTTRWMIVIEAPG